MILKKRLFFAFLFVLITLCSCLDLHDCESDIAGTYYCYNDKKAVNYLKLSKNGTFYHFYHKGKTKLVSEGTWKKNTDGYCSIALSEWKNFNERGENFELYGNGILYLNDGVLNMSPDGKSSTSFVKK